MAQLQLFARRCLRLHNANCDRVLGCEVVRDLSVAQFDVMLQFVTHATSLNRYRGLNVRVYVVALLIVDALVVIGQQVSVQVQCYWTRA
jgi:hypothetical protein